MSNTTLSSAPIKQQPIANDKRIQNDYRIIIVNDDTFEEVVTFKVNRNSVWITTGGVVVSFLFVVFSIIFFTPVKYYIPGYGNHLNRSELQILKIKTDSLEHVLEQNAIYLKDIKGVLNGTTPSKRDTARMHISDNEIYGNDEN
ncbi:MAG: hypothetical protein QM528_05955 [Phycisphaerales bacterium]|nr:hypothetical protein [Phycisphaerales bacterium]